MDLRGLVPRNNGTLPRIVTCSMRREWSYSAQLSHGAAMCSDVLRGNYEEACRLVEELPMSRIKRLSLNAIGQKSVFILIHLRFSMNGSRVER